MDVDSIVANLINGVYARIQRSPIHGVGVFALRDIPFGVDPFTKPAHCSSAYVHLSQAILNELDENVVNYFKDMVVLKEGIYLYPDCGLNGIDISWFVNHSDNPNLRVASVDYDCETIRNISKGEELFVDYNTISSDNPIRRR
ncbi:MAG: SET domain-containing protein-lysine N-methyltransferase [Verrucomicrobia bacterium]|nr:SET domain-containing protein-lysine N-methyltransferase [Verrucomicrobiota bacterium]